MQYFWLPCWGIVSGSFCNLYVLLFFFVFQHDNLEHLALMQACLGPFPDYMTRTREARNYFDRHGVLMHKYKGSRSSLRHVAQMKSLRVRG